jgi:geranyl-CoA carboxylase beta subunit
MVMSIVAEGQAKAAGVEPDREALRKQEACLTTMFNSQSSAFYTSGHMMDDGMIDPRETRRTLGFLLATVWEGRNRTVRPNSFGVGRM